ncbi:MAG: cation:proton antiporter [Pseudomonadota bacterium]
MILVAVFVSVFFLYSLIARRLEQSVVTGPMIFTTAGILAVVVMPELHELEGNRTAFLWFAEIGLVMTLFSDASRVNLQALKADGYLPFRLLSAGMLLTILLGTLIAVALFPSLTVWEAGVLAAILAPTDAGLGQIIVNSPRVPSLVRRSLNVEAGLNDGLAVPFMMLFIALAASGTEGAGAVMVRFIVEQLGFGTLVGLLTGLIGGGLLGPAQRNGWSSHAFEQLGLVALPLFCIIASKPTGASMFIAAFTAGLAVQAGFKDAERICIEFTEEWGQALNSFVFFLFGLFVAGAWEQFNLTVVVYAVLSLTVVRMLPVAVALTGTGLKRATVLFMGWFGPRGLASIVLGLVFLEEEARLPGEPTVRIVVMATVLLSIFAHGITALPGIALYARKVSGSNGTDPVC